MALAQALGSFLAQVLVPLNEPGARVQGPETPWPHLRDSVQP